MNKTQRITLNIAATYCRSLVGLVCGLFTARWILMALGECDFGIWCVIGGLASFVTFLNTLFAGATVRFFAYSVGRDEGDWFRTAVIVHVALATGLVIVGYPIGVWVVQSVLDIPAARVADAVIVFRCVVAASWMGMVSVPFAAMYTARQNIAEVSVWGFVQTLAHFGFLWYAVTHPQNWFLGYAFGVTLINTVVALCVMIGAMRRYSSCREWGLVVGFGARLKEMGIYTFWQLFGGLGSLARTQGLNVLLNRLVGTTANASFGIASQMNGQAQSLSAALQGAFIPVITSSLGSGEKFAARRTAFQTCRLSLTLMLVFTIPLMLELDEVLRLWLVRPPQGVAILCLSVLSAFLVDKATSGHVIVLNANGKLGSYQVTVGCLLILTLPLAWMLHTLGFGLAGIGIALVAGSIAAGFGRVFFARRLVGMGTRVWLKQVVLPALVLTGCTTGIGMLPRLVMEASFVRVCFTTTASLTVFIPLAWFLMLSREERAACLMYSKRGQTGPSGDDRREIVFVARSTNPEIVAKSSSGGIFSVLAQAVIRQGGAVIGAAFGGRASEVRHIVVRDEAGLAKLRGAKYVRSELGNALSAECNVPSNDESVLFSGCPCQVAAVRRQHPDWLFVEVVCHGVPQQAVVKAYLKDIKSIDFRDKRTGWMSYSVSTNAGSSIWYFNSFMKGYVANLYLDEGCTRCPFKNGASGADITLGDYWNAAERFPRFADDRGASLVVVRTERGRALWQYVQGEVIAEESDLKHAIAGNPALDKSFSAHSKAEQFKRDLAKGVPFELAVDRALRPLWRRLGSWIKGR